MNRPLLSLIVAFVGYSLLNISQAGQKIGLSLLKIRRLPGSLIWTAATLGTLGAALINLYALSLGSVSLVGAMAGSGLASLALFSWLVMKERVGAQELAGIGFIVAAALLIGGLARPSGSQTPRIEVLYAILGAVSVVYTVLWAVFHRRNPLMTTVIAGFSGTLGGFVALFQKLSTTEQGRSQSLARGLGSLQKQPGLVSETLSNPYTLAWIAIGMLSMVVLQFAYRRGEAIRIIPSFSANYVVVPILGGMLVFGESLHPLQWFGAVLMVTGVLLLTLKSPGCKVPPTVSP